MKTKKLFTLTLLGTMLAIGLFNANETVLAEELHPLGLIVLHEDIPDIKPVPRLFGLQPALPSQVDLSGRCPPVGNQQYMGSCVAFAVAYAAKTFQEGIDWGWDVKTNNHIFSPSYMYSQIHYDNSCGGGGAYFSVAFRLLQRQGCTTLDDMPYSGYCYDWRTQPTEQQKANAANHRVNQWAPLPYGDYEAMKARLAQGNPVVIGIPVYPDFDYLNPNNPIYDDISGKFRGNHALCVIGYDDSKQAVKFINSWGTSWGLNGYGWMSYDLIYKISVEAYTMEDYIDANGFGGWDALFSGYGNQEAIPVPADYDGDDKVDLSVKTNSGEWLIDYACTGFTGWDVKIVVYENQNGFPVPADYDGDGKVDLSIKTTEGRWLIDYAANGFGSWDVDVSGYRGIDAYPAPADFDGDGKTDMAIHFTGGVWMIDFAANGFGTWDWRNYRFDYPEGFPVPADYDGDGYADLSIKAINGEWLIDYSRNGFNGWDVFLTGYGGADDIPVPADYDGDKKIDLGLKTNDGRWLIDYAGNGFGYWDAGRNGYGGTDSWPVPADYDRDGKADLSVKTGDGRWLIDYAARKQ